MCQTSWLCVCFCYLSVLNVNVVVQIVNSCTFVPFWQVIEGIEDMYFSEDGDVAEVELLVWCIICGQRVIGILPDCVWGTKVVAIVACV